MATKSGFLLQIEPGEFQFTSMSAGRGAGVICIGVSSFLECECFLSLAQDCSKIIAFFHHQENRLVSNAHLTSLVAADKKNVESGLIQIRNPTSSYILFKIKTTAPQQFCVKPCLGKLAPGDSTTGTTSFIASTSHAAVDVRLTTFESKKVKFLIQAVALFPDEDPDALCSKDKVRLSHVPFSSPCSLYHVPSPMFPLPFSLSCSLFLRHCLSSSVPRR